MCLVQVKADIDDSDRVIIRRVYQPIWAPDPQEALKRSADRLLGVVDAVNAIQRSLTKAQSILELVKKKREGGNRKRGPIGELEKFLHEWPQHDNWITHDFGRDIRHLKNEYGTISIPSIWYEVLTPYHRARNVWPLVG